MAKKTDLLPIRLTPLMRGRVEKAADERQESLAEWIRRAIEMRLDKEGK